MLAKCVRVISLIDHLISGARRYEHTFPVAIGCDEAGFELKELLKRHIEGLGYPVTDFGTHSTAPVLYPDIALAVATAINAGQQRLGVLVCGTGIAWPSRPTRCWAFVRPRPMTPIRRSARARATMRKSSPSARGSSVRSWPKASSVRFGLGVRSGAVRGQGRAHQCD